MVNTGPVGICVKGHIPHQSHSSAGRKALHQETARREQEGLRIMALPGLKSQSGDRHPNSDP